MAEPQRFTVLDGWRGVAALGVALFHLDLSGHLNGLEIIRNGRLFVDFFFVLSGFVITHAYFEALHDGLGLRSFVIRRFGRIWPLHAAVLLFLVGREGARAALVAAGVLAPQPVFDAASGSGLTQLVTSLLLIQGVGIDQSYAWNVPAWSISSEFWTYIVFAGLCVGLKRRATTIACAVIAGTSLLWLAAFSPDYLMAGLKHPLVRCFAGFFAGHLTYRLWTIAKPITAGRTSLEIAALVLTLAYMSLVKTTAADPWTLAAPVVFSVLVFIFAGERGAISRAINSRAFQALGLWSYSIYMIHEPAAYTFGKIYNGCVLAASGQEASSLYQTLCGHPSLNRISSPWAADAVQVLYLGTIILAASVTFRLIEAPARRWFYRQADRLDEARAGRPGLIRR